MACKQYNNNRASTITCRFESAMGAARRWILAVGLPLLAVAPFGALAQTGGYTGGYPSYPTTSRPPRVTNPPASAPQTQPPTDSPRAVSSRDAAEAMTRGDYAIAYCHYHPLARQGDAEAQYNLGWMYANGYGLAQDEAKALIWWRKAARQNHSDAVVAVAMAYLHGDGTKKDKTEALKWLVEAAEHGVDDAMEIILTLVAQETPEAKAVMARLIQENSDLLTVRYRIKVPRANVRKGPDKGQALIETLKEGDPLVGLGAEGNWIRVGLPGSGQIGWIYKTLLEPAQRQ
ncbi:MAG: SH3 domain-containing protein [Gammaproteobacteria bacterium]